MNHILLTPIGVLLLTEDIEDAYSNRKNSLSPSTYQNDFTPTNTVTQLETLPGMSLNPKMNIERYIMDFNPYSKKWNCCCCKLPCGLQIMAIGECNCIYYRLQSIVP
ncbi:hypothetical protein DICVIV_09857 [Dictyocaulus viviparus]|uniref:Uncharacterized protein n=1 Tax=Dictyocaulus viviparus TaxID=29172 RepID=A0A0D8XJU1_DICVI|nr:hypothetical protein DICVIV_09857 [Dictyocaulus viviparus]